MKKIFLIIGIMLVAAVAGAWGLSAQDSGPQGRGGGDRASLFLQSVEQNNTTLQALRQQADARKVENRTGLTPGNPEVEFGYLWGDAVAGDNKYDFSVTQSFDFPSAYVRMKQLAGHLDREVDLIYELQRREILSEARNVYVETIYRLRNREVLTARLDNARRLHDAYRRRLENGDTDIIEYNKTHLNLINTEKDWQFNEAELGFLAREAERLNGGIPFDAGADYPGYALPADFDGWFSRVSETNPLMALAAQQVETSRKQEQVTRSLNLPKLSAGYQNAYEGGGRFNGFTVGMSIPLWENRNTVKAQKAQTRALETERRDSELRFRNALYSQYEKGARLAAVLARYEEAMGYADSGELLAKAFDAGQISLITFLQELTAWYEAEDACLETRRDYELAAAQLAQWEE